MVKVMVSDGRIDGRVEDRVCSIENHKNGLVARNLL